MKKIKLGVAITVRDMFPPQELAKSNIDSIHDKVREIMKDYPEVECIFADSVVPNGVMTELDEEAKVEKLFREHEIDGLFIPHANFGQEETAAILAYNLKVPVLLWGPRDGSPVPGAPFRDTDTQCGLFATTRAMLRFGVEFTYAENCWIDSPMFREKLDHFIRVVSVVKTFRHLRILQIGARPRQFLSVKVNEGELMEKFGIQIVPVNDGHYVSVINRLLEEDSQQLKDQVAKMKGRADTSAMAEEDVRKMAAIYLAIRSLADELECQAVASECWEVYRMNYGIAPCFVFACLSQDGLPVCCEDDINGAVSSIIAQAAGLFREPSFLADITVRNPLDDNSELLWHCGPFPPALAKNSCAKVCDGRGAYELKPGKLTLVRFDGDHGVYKLLGDTADTTDGPETDGNYVWIKVKSWPAWEEKLMYGPYIHHIAGVYGDYKAVLKEACKYLGTVYDYVEA